jgi:hypothetical protein
MNKNIEGMGKTVQRVDNNVEGMNKKIDRMVPSGKTSGFCLNHVNLVHLSGRERAEQSQKGPRK